MTMIDILIFITIAPVRYRKKCITTRKARNTLNQYFMYCITDETRKYK